MQQSPVRKGSDPQAAIAIAKHPPWSELQPGRKRIRLGFPICQVCDSGLFDNQHSAGLALDERVDSLRRIRHRKEPGWSRVPSPQAGHPSRPEIASAVFIQGGHARAETAVLSIALDNAAPNAAESPDGGRPPGAPDGSFTIFKQR